MLALPVICVSNNTPCIISNAGISINVFLSNKSCSELIIGNGVFVLKENSTTNTLTGTRGHFKIIGNESIIECEQNAGLAFKNISNIEIKNVTFYKCGMPFNSTSKNLSSTNETLTSNTALLFEYCKNVSLKFVKVNNSDGVGIQIYNTFGTVHISHSTFYQNKVENPHAVSGGGGIYIEFSLCDPETICKSNFTTYEITFSNFVKNIGSTTDPQRTGTIHAGYHEHFAFGRGGGISIYFMGNASCNVFNIINCYFTENKGQFGAGMFVAFQDSCHNNTLNVKDSRFISNQVIEKKLDYIGTSGGGVMLDYVIVNNKEYNIILLHNKATFNNVTFESNAAFIGGGFSFHASKEYNVTKPTNSLHFIGCHWFGNKARLGAAIDLSTLRIYQNGQQVKPHFINCTFVNNTVTSFTIEDVNDTYGIKDDGSTNTSGGYWPGTGAMYLDALTIDFEGNVTFANNIGGAIVAINAGINVNPKATVNFSNNHAELGGALYLSGKSGISASSHVQVLFINNSALYGGAIFYQKDGEHDLMSSVNCFIRYSDITLAPDHWHNVTFLFLDNCVSTDYGGDAIHMTTVVDCAWNGSFNPRNDYALKQIFLGWPNFNFSSSVNRCNNFIQTSARYINFETIKEIRVAPGQKFKFPFKALNDFNSSTVKTFFLYSNEKQMSLPIPVVQTNGITSFKTSKINSSFYLQFETIDNRKHVGYITVTVENCPLGYKLKNDACECIAASQSNSYEGLDFCEPDMLELYVRPGYWAGDVGGFFSTYTCPFSYCIQTSSSVALTNDSDVLCNNRMGRLCGDCKDGYGLSVGTLNCVNCTGSHVTAWIILITTTYVPITIVFISLLVLNINLAVGPIHSFIFFCQVFPAVSLDNNQWGDYSPAITVISDIHSAIINVMSLKFNVYLTTNYCLFANMNAMDYYLLQYASALYPLLILVIIVSIIRYCPGCLPAKYLWYMMKCCVKAVRKRTSMQQTIVHGLIGFLLLTYANFVNISFQILKYAYFEDKSDQYNSILVPFRQGTMYYFDKHHLPYALVATTFLLIFGILPPVILIFYPTTLTIIAWFGWDDTTKVRTLRKWIPLYKLIPIFDAFWSELKPRCRAFAGFFFLYRLLAFSLFSLTLTLYQIYFGISILFIIITFLHAFVQPYKKESNNKADFFMFAIISVTNSFYAHSEFLRTQNISLRTIQICVWIQTILPWIPILYIICYIILKVKQAWQKDCNRLFDQHSYRRCQ